VAARADPPAARAPPTDADSTPASPRPCSPGEPDADGRSWRFTRRGKNTSPRTARAATATIFSEWRARPGPAGGIAASSRARRSRAVSPRRPGDPRLARVTAPVDGAVSSPRSCGPSPERASTGSREAGRRTPSRDRPRARCRSVAPVGLLLQRPPRMALISGGSAGLWAAGGRASSYRTR